MNTKVKMVSSFVVPTACVIYVANSFISYYVLKSEQPNNEFTTTLTQWLIVLFQVTVELFFFQKKCVVLWSYSTHINISKGSGWTNGCWHHVKSALSTVCHVSELVYSRAQIHYTRYVTPIPQEFKDACSEHQHKKYWLTHIFYCRMCHFYNSEGSHYT